MKKIIFWIGIIGAVLMSFTIPVDDSTEKKIEFIYQNF